MLNIKKGNGLTLQQADMTVGVGATTVVAGMIVGLSSGVATLATSSVKALGFTINNATDGDAVESGKQGIYLFAGGDVVETDQYTETLTTSTMNTTYAPGTPVYADVNGGTGKITTTSTSNLLIGYSVGARVLPAAKPTDLAASGYTYVDKAGTTVTPSPQPNIGWKSVVVVGVKLQGVAQT